MRIVADGSTDKGSKYVPVRQTKNQDTRRTAFFWVLRSE